MGAQMCFDRSRRNEAIGLLSLPLLQGGSAEQAPLVTASFISLNSKDGTPAFDFFVAPSGAQCAVGPDHDDSLPSPSDGNSIDNNGVGDGHAPPGDSSGNRRCSRSSSSWPGHMITRTFEEFQALDRAIHGRYRKAAPVLPPSTIFTHSDEAFLQERARHLEAYLVATLQLEPFPRTRALRSFLNVWQPCTWTGDGHGAGGFGSVGPILLGVHQVRLPVSVGALILSYLAARDCLRAGSRVSKAWRAASRNGLCWPTLRLSAVRAERWLDHFFSILAPSCLRLQQLTLDFAFENPRLAVAFPGGLAFRSLKRLTLRPRDAEAATLFSEVLESINSPELREVFLEGCLDEQVLQSLAALGSPSIDAVRCSFAPPRSMRPVAISEASLRSLRQFVRASPNLRRVRLDVSPEARGKHAVARSMASLNPPEVEMPETQPWLADLMALPRLEEVSFDFFSRHALEGLRTTMGEAGADGPQLMARRVSLSAMKDFEEDPDTALATVLSRLGPNLQDFSLLYEVASEMRPYTEGFLHQRIGALPNLWAPHRSMLSLTVNWTAFDDEGMRCIAENCPVLESCFMDHCEYWTDEVGNIVVERFLNLRRFRMRSSALLSDRCLYRLMEVAPRLLLLELEPSHLMSSYAVEELRQRMGASMDGGGGVDGFFSLAPLGPMGLITAAAEAFDPTFGVHPGDFALAAPPLGHGGVLRILDDKADLTRRLEGTGSVMPPGRFVEIGR